jgi:hypothetical protein
MPPARLMPKCKCENTIVHVLRVGLVINDMQVILCTSLNLI